MSGADQRVGGLLALAVEAYGRGEFQAVILAGQTARQIDPGNAAACNLMGLATFALGDHAAAVAHLQAAVALDPGDAQYANNLGVVLHALGEAAQARPAFEQALALDPQMAHAANNLGSVLEKLGDDAAAIHSYRRALEIDPAYVEARDNLVLICARVAPQWHFPMMADGARNGAYAEAIARAVPGRRVLDIGSGSGLLAMMAARAGAASVDTCEMQPVIAGVAAGIVAANGFAGRVGVWSLKSDELEVGRELAAPAEVLVTETFSSGLLSERVLPTVEDAHSRLLAPDAVIVPRRAAAVGYLLGGPIVERHLFAAPWGDLDLSGFNVLAPFKLGLHLDRLPHEALSADFDIFSFDLTRPPFPAERRQIEVEATAAGRCVGVAQWLRLDLDETLTYENRPSAGAGANGWMHVMYRFARPVEVAAGDRLSLIVSHNRTEIVVALAEAA
ncbi:MAG TPA: tetratricopeptide repeat protein [Phenylobacterium sp.]|nr:tetratricopeptide repeat protein [Phenylobacterium sp.]